MLGKDDVLDRIADKFNVAQFVSVSFDTPKVVRHARINGVPGAKDLSVRAAVECLLNSNPERKVNIRTFRTGESKGGEFIVGVQDALTVLNQIDRLSREGFSVIVNESIDRYDGGVSGVTIGDLVEFAPEDSPRCVEKPGVCRLPRGIADSIFRSVYGVDLDFQASSRQRVEFSLHPIRRGYRNQHQIVWEVEDLTDDFDQGNVRPKWPNRFSSFIGDKLFGLLVANTIGCKVPYTIAICRSVAPFVFGERTHTNDFWSRTAPSRQLPGKLPTKLGHMNPFTLLKSLEADAEETLASLLSQENVPSVFSGASAMMDDGEVLVEGVAGSGDSFMLGVDAPSLIPQEVKEAVIRRVKFAASKLGPVRMEWVFDGNEVWTVQLHVGAISSDPHVIFQGNAERWVVFNVNEGLDSLRKLLVDTEGSSVGVRLQGDVGVTSHFGDLLRGRRIPSTLHRHNTQ